MSGPGIGPRPGGWETLCYTTYAPNITLSLSMWNTD